MKIFILPSWYKSDKHPENCIFIYEQVQGLYRLGHQIIVLSPQLTLYPFCNRRIEMATDDSSIIMYRNFWTLWPAKFPRHNIRSFERCAFSLFESAILQHGTPDVIYAHFSSPAGLVASRIGRTYNIPVVVEEHYSGLMQPHLPKYRKMLMKETVENCNSFICVSLGLRKAVEKLVGARRNIKVVSNMINPCFQYCPPRKGTFTFLSIGSLIPRKGFEFLIQCFTEVFKGKNVQLKIAGSGPLKTKLEALIKTFGMQNQVFLIGQLSREETLAQYKQSHCFVLASKAETFGLVYREAMAVGRPIISTRHGGFSDEDWHNNYGQLVDYGDVKALKTSLLYIYEYYREFDLNAISNLCLSTCSENIVIKQIEKTLKEASGILG